MRHWLVVCLLLAALDLGTASQVGRAQCVARTIRVKRVEGTVFDPSGQPIPRTEVSLKKEGKVVATTKTDDTGQFSLAANPGAFVLFVNARGFPPDSAPIDVGNDLIAAFRPTRMWIILKPGRLLDGCALYLTTNRKQFERVVLKPEHGK